MRRPTVILAAALLASACDKEPAAQDVRQTDQQLARDNLESNDLTAIDAASGADSNMAADLDIASLANTSVEDEDASANRQARPPVRAPSPRPAPDEGNGGAEESPPPEPEDGAE